MTVRQAPTGARWVQADALVLVALWAVLPAVAAVVPVQVARARCHPKRCALCVGSWTGVTSSTMGPARWFEKSFQGSCSSCCSGGGGALASEAVAGVCAALAKQAGGAFRGVAVGPVVGRLSSSESGGSGGGALRGGGATGSGAPTSSTACGMNLAVGDSVLLDAGCLLCGDGARLGGARCAGGSLGS